MNRRMIFIVSILGLALLGAALLSACGQTGAPASSQGSTAPDGQALFQERCTSCHSADRAMTAHKTADEWKVTVERMISHGAKLNTQEQQILIDYLAQTYP